MPGIQDNAKAVAEISEDVHMVAGKMNPSDPPPPREGKKN
jgi:hypothetical protein